MEDDKILDDLRLMSGGALTYPGMELADVKNNVPRPQQYPVKQKSNRKGNQQKRH